MARRKRAYLDDGDSSGSDSDGASASGSVAVDGVEHSGSSRRDFRRRRAKDDAIYGVFGSDDEIHNEQDGGAGRTVRARAAKGRKVDYLRGQAFVSAASNEGHGEVGQGSEAGLAMESDANRETSTASSSEMDSDDDDVMEKALDSPASTARPSLGSRAGIGSRGPNADSEATARPRLGNASFAQMFQRGGIGSSSGSSSMETTPSLRAPVFAKASSDTLAHNATTEFEPLPAAPAATPLPTPSAPKVLFKTGAGAGGKFDPSKYLAAMGWSGGGLGKQGEGIVNPIEVKQRPERAGIAFGGRREKTKQAKEEARRRGEDVSSDDEDRKAKAKTSKGRSERKSNNLPIARAWTKPEKKPRKPKIEHRTYEEILEQHGHAHAGPAATNSIIDAAGNEYTSISAALARHSVPSTEPTQLIELLHNIQIICLSNSANLQTLAGEGAHILEQHKWLQRDRDESRRRHVKASADAAKLEKTLKYVEEIEALGKRSQKDPLVTLEDFEVPVRSLTANLDNKDVQEKVDEAIVASMLTIFRREMTTWQPLQEPTRLTKSIAALKTGLHMDKSTDVMTPYESMLWNLWMPPIRSAINNDWDLRRPEPVISLLKAWAPILPPFICDNVTQQLILPKLRAAVTDWDGKSSLYKIVFPWMPVLNKQMDDVLSEAKRRLRSSLKTLHVSQGPPRELKHWRDVLSKKEWDSMMLHHVVDKLSVHLQRHLRIQPQAQDMEPLEQVLAWRSLMSTRIMSKLLLARFLPPWLNTLHAWLKSPSVNFEDVAAWYEHWKRWFEAHGAYSIDSVQKGFSLALETMDAAIGLGSDRSSLPPPNLAKLQGHDTEEPSISNGKSNVQAGATGVPEIDDTVTFRQIIDDAAAAADLLVMPLNRIAARNGMALLRIARGIDGKNGTTFFIEDDVAFAEQRGVDGGITYMPVSVNDLIASAK